LGEQLRQGNNKRYIILEPRFPPVVGSVLLALKQLNITIDDDIIENLSEHTIVGNE
jgi:glucosamine kinase